MTLVFINWITAANWLQGSMKLQTPLSNKHQFVPTHDFTWTFKACYMHSGTTSESIFEHVLLKQTARKNRIEMTHSSNPDPLKQRAVLPCACAVLYSVRRSAEGMRASDSWTTDPDADERSAATRATHGVRECHGRKLFPIHWLWGKESLSHWVGSLFLTWRHNCS